jgi:hypothetical protein
MIPHVVDGDKRPDALWTSGAVNAGHLAWVT